VNHEYGILAGKYSTGEKPGGETEGQKSRGFSRSKRPNSSFSRPRSERKLSSTPLCGVAASLYRKESRNDPYDASIRNLRKAFESPRWHPPRPWRSKEEARMVRRYVLLWLTCRDASRPSGRSWAKQLGISHTWLQKVVRQLYGKESRLSSTSKK